MPEEEREERVPDGMRHLQERTMSLEDQVKNLQAQVQGHREGGDGALHPGGQGLGDGRALRGGEPGGDRALQHGRAREDPDGVQGWQDQVERLEKLLHERHGHGGPTWYQYGSGIPGEHGGDRAGNHGGFRGDRAWHGKEDVGDLDEKDTLKAVPVTLPVLPPQEGKEAGIVCGDWMVQVRLLIGDVAPNALQWWDDLMAEVMCRYQNWLQAGPLERLQMPSPQQGKSTTTMPRDVDWNCEFQQCFWRPSRGLSKQSLWRHGNSPQERSCTRSFVITSQEEYRRKLKCSNL